MEIESGGAILAQISRFCADRKKLALIIVSALLFCAISIKLVIHSDNVEEFPELKNETEKTQRSKSHIGYAERLLEREGICFDMHVFLIDKKKPIQVKNVKNEPNIEKEDINKTLSKKYGLSHTSLIGIMLGFLVISVIVAAADALKVKRAERSSQPSPDSEGSERCSLAEFANMKRPRRQSSINDASSSKYTGLSSRKESLGSDSTKGKKESNTYLQGAETPNTPPVSTGKGPFKLLGARPAPLLRRSSFPASLMNELNRRRFSADSEEDSSPDVGKRRVRIIRIH